MSRPTSLHVALATGSLAVGLAVLFLASGMGAPDDGAGGTGTDGGEDWASRERVLEVERDRPTQFDFTSRPEANRSQDVLQGRFDASEATYRFEFQDRPREAQGENGTATNATWVAATLDFVGLVEYRDETGDRTFNPPTDEVVNRLWLAGNRSSSLTVEETNLGAQRATATFPFNNGGSLKIVLLASPTSYNVRELVHPPTVTAMDIRLDNFPAREDDTEVALHVNLSTPGPLDLDADEDRVRVPAEGEDEELEGRFAWTRDLGGTGSTTNATTVEVPRGDDGAAGSQAHVLFTYPADERFVHGTAMGIHHPPTLAQQALQFLGNWYVFAGALSATLLLLGGSMYVKLQNEDAGPPYP